MRLKLKALAFAGAVYLSSKILHTSSNSVLNIV